MVLDKASFLRLAPRVFYGALYIAAIVFMLVRFADFKNPDYGYAWMPQFGAQFNARKAEEFKQTKHVITSRYGYDGQFYAQLALDPTLSNPETLGAMDNPMFRARRILFSASAFVLGGGEPNAVVQAYSYQNIIYWILSAIILLYWLPPTNWQNAARYLAILFTAGMMHSVTQALLDGPALTLVLLGALLWELRRETAGSFVLGIAGLGKESSIFAASGLALPNPRELRSILAWIGRLALVAAPLFLWYLYLRSQVEVVRGGSLGSGAFDWPLAGWWKAVVKLFERLGSESWMPFNYLTVLFLVAMPLQAICVLTRPQLKSLWWRIGAVFAVFTLIFGYAVWEGVVGAAARTALPLTVAFNILLPRSWRWVPMLILGNALTFIGIQHLLATAPPRVEMSLGADYQSRLPLDGSPYPLMRIDDGWYGEERDGARYWMWSDGTATLSFDNPSAQPATAVLTLQLHTRAPRTVIFSVNDQSVEVFPCFEDSMEWIEARLPLAAGPNTIRIYSPEPPIQVPPDTRDLSFAIQNYVFRVE